MNIKTVLVNFLFAIIRVDPVVINARLAAVNCWRTVLLLVAACTKLSREPTRASMTSVVAAGMMLLAALVNGSSVAPARCQLMPLAYTAT